MSIKKLLLVLVALFLVQYTYADYGVYKSGLYYTLVGSINDGKVKVTNCTERVQYIGNGLPKQTYQGNVVIPRTVAIDFGTYSGTRTYIVTEIDDYAFATCENLTSVSLPETIERIGYYSFYGCKKLTSITLPDAVTQIPSYAFCGCTSLTSVTIPESVTTIGDYAFYSCSALRQVSAPSVVTPTGLNAFTGTSLGEFYLNNMLVNSPNYQNAQDIDYKIKDGTIAICDGAFSKKFKSISYPSTVRYIGREAFVKDQSIVTKYQSSLTCPENAVCGLGGNLFSGSYSSYGSGASYVKHFDVPDGIIEFPEKALEYCYLDEIHFPSSIQKVSFPSYYNHLDKLILDDIAAWCNVEIPIYSNAPLYGGGGKLFLGDEQITHLVIPEGISEVKKACFVDCKTVTELTLPNSLVTIGESAFENLGITELVVPNGVKNIEKWAFNRCKSLQKIWLPEYLETIGEGSFANNNLNEIQCEAVVPPVFIDPERAFQSDVYTNATLFVPAESIELYKSAEGWKNFENIQPIIQGKCAAPVIKCQNNKFVFECETEGAEFFYEITSSASGCGKEIEYPSVTVSVTAKAEGYEPSETITRTFTAEELTGIQGDTNGDGALTISDVTSLINKIIMK